MSKSSSYQNYSSNSNHDQLNSNITSAVYKIKQTVNQLTQLNKQVGSSKDSPKLRENIEDILVSTKDLLTEATANVRALSKVGGAQDSGVAFERTKKELATEVAKFGEIEKIILEKLKKQPVGGFDASSNFEPNSDDIENERSLLLKQERISQLDEGLKFMQDRESKIRQIESDILDVNAITRELASMVYEQNSLIDNISSNVDRTHQTVESGNVELVKANRYAAKSRKKILILIFIILVVLVALGLIIYLSIRH